MALDQYQTTSHVDSMALSLYGSRRLAQIFQAGLSGQISTVKLWMRRWQSPADLVVEIRTVSAGDPTAVILASEEVVSTDVSNVSDGAELTIDFSSPAEVTAGTSYAIVIKQKSDGGDSNNVYLMYGSYFIEYYANGINKYYVSSWLQFTTTLDAYFETYVVPLPVWENINETLVLSESNQFTKIKHLDVSEGIQIAEVAPAISLSFLEDLGLEESLIPQLSFEDSIVHYRDFLQSYNHHDLNPPYHYETWYIENPVVGDSVNRVLAPHYVGSIDRVIVHCKDKGSAGQTKIDVKLNNDSIFYHDSEKPSLAFNDSNNYSSSEEPYLKLIGKTDVITVDIESVATGATGLTVNVAVSQTAIPINVRKIEAITEDGFVYTGNEVFNDSSLSFKIYYSTSVLLVPQVTVVDGDGVTTNLEVDSITSTTMPNDCIITKSLDVSEYVGMYSLIIKNATSYTGALQDPFEKKYDFSDSSISILLQYTKFVSTSTLSVSFENLEMFKDSLSQYSYSLNGTDWTTDVNLSNPFEVDVTNASVGGSNSEETKIIYIRFKNEEGEGYLTATLSVGYYYAAISLDALYYAYDANTYIIKYSLPASSTTVPPKGIEVYNGSTLLKSITFESIPLSDFDITTTLEQIPTPDRYKIEVDAGYTTGTTGEDIYSTPANIFYVDRPTSSVELYLIMIEQNTSTMVCELVKSANLSTSLVDDQNHPAITYEDFIQEAVSRQEDYIVLYGFQISRGEVIPSSTVYNLVHNYTSIVVQTSSTSLDLSVKLLDWAGRTYTNDMTDLIKNNEMSLRVYAYKSPEEDRVSQEIENATIVNTPPDYYYVRGEYL